MSCAAGPNPLLLGWYPVYEFDMRSDIVAGSYDASYTVNNSATAPSFTRVLYILKLNEFSVWCEFDDFTSNTAARVGVPASWIYDVAVTNLVVRVNNPGSGFPGANQSTIVNRTSATGRINFWPSNYSVGGDGLYNAIDTGYDTGNGYGSFQVFDTAPATPECIFAWNAWGINEYGIGSNASGQPDWTFTSNGAQFLNRLCRIYVK